MYTSKINIKHNRSAKIHWGIHKLTNEIVWIDDVEGNGYACNCKCACCGSDLKACTQGKIQQHHFKHRGNNGCYYSDEIAEYLKANELLSSLTTMWIPPITVRIGSRPQIIRSAVESCIDNLFCSYDANHYPPLLIADIDKTPTRIILSFSGYYEPNDYKQLIEDSIENNWDCLEIILPQKEDGIVITKTLLYEYISGMTSNKRWIFNSKTHNFFVRLKKASKKLAPIHIKYDVTTDIEYECPLHKREYGGSFYALKNDCKECGFRLDFFSDACRCLAESYIHTLADLDIPEDIRRERFYALRKENETKLRKSHSPKGAPEIVHTIPKDNHASNDSNHALPDTQAVKDSFQKQVCPYCGKRLHKHIGKTKVNWLCLTSHCGFVVIEDKETHTIQIVNTETEVK